MTAWQRCIPMTFWALSAILTPPAAEASVDGSTRTLVLVNGKVWTGDPDRPTVTALAIRDGRILSVGTDADVESAAGGKFERIDLRGRRVVPGINDAHEHLGWQGIPGEVLDLPELEPTSADLEAALAEQPTEGREWINGVVGARILADDRWNAARLDELQPQRPVVLQGFTGHGMLLNTAAIRALDVNADIPVPGGWYGRDSNGAFDGHVNEYAQYRVESKFTHPGGDAWQIERLQQYAAGASRAGITSVQSMNWLPIHRFVQLWEQSGAPQRIRVIRWPAVTADPAPIPGLDVPKSVPGTRIEVSGTKWIVDGTIVEQLSPMRQPYPDTGRTGRLNFTPAELRARIEEAMARNDQILLHAIGDAATESLLDTLASIAPPERWQERRLRIEHGDGLAPDLIKRAAEFGVVVVLSPSHQMLPPGVPVATLIRERQLSPFLDLVKAGISIAIGSDGPNDPWLNMMFATHIPTRPDQSLTREQVLEAYTWGSAYAEFHEEEKGRLIPGYLADLAVLSQDVLDEQAVPGEALPQTSSLLTIIGGDVVWRDPAFQ